jgi:hypothetical protein
MSRHTETEIKTHAKISILVHANPFMILVNYTHSEDTKLIPRASDHE